MSIDATGFEFPLSLYTVGGWTSTGLVTFETASPHRDFQGNGGVQYVRIGGSEARFRSKAYSNPTTLKWMGCAYRQLTAGNGYASQILFLNSDNVVQALVMLRANDGACEIRRQWSFGPILATAASPFVLNVWYWLDIEVKIADSGGVIRVYPGPLVVTPLLEFVGDTEFTTPNGFVYVAFGGDGGGGGPRGDFDDYVLRTEADGRAPYECFIPLVLPSGVGSQTQLTSSSGNPNWQNVNEMPPSTTQYNEGTAAFEGDFYAKQPLPWTPEFDPLGMTVWAWAARDGSITQGQVGILSAGIEEVGPGANLAGAGQYVTISQFFSEDPNGPIPWTTATLDAAQVGFYVL